MSACGIDEAAESRAGTNSPNGMGGDRDDYCQSPLKSRTKPIASDSSSVPPSPAEIRAHSKYSAIQDAVGLEIRPGRVRIGGGRAREGSCPDWSG